MKRAYLPHEISEMETYYDVRSHDALQESWDRLLRLLEKSSSSMTATKPYIPRYWADVVHECVKKMLEIDPLLRIFTITRYGHKLLISHTPAPLHKDKLDKLIYAANNKLNNILVDRIITYFSSPRV